MSNKIWNLKYRPGNSNRVIEHADNPQNRSSALNSAAVVANNGWEVWVEHAQTGKRIFESVKQSTVE